MGETPEPPPWGTPDEPLGPGGGGRQGGEGQSPEYGTPSAPSYGTPDGATAAASDWRNTPAGHEQGGHGQGGYGTPGAAVLLADTVHVIERNAFMGNDSYELIDDDGAALGSVIQEASAAGFFFGGAASTTFRMLGPHGELVASMLRPGSIGRSTFVVTDARDIEIGSVEQENAFLAPQFRITTSDGLVMRLTGGRLGSGEWQLVDGLDESVLMGLVSRQSAGLGGMLGDTQRFAVQLSPQLVGAHRLLALMATVCLDFVRDAKRRR